MPQGQMTTSQARVVDPVNTEIAHGYQHPERTGNALFPIVNIAQRGQKVIKFDKRSFRSYNARRAPGANTKRVQFGYDSEPSALVQESLEGTVPWELMQDAAAVPGVDLSRDSVEEVMDILTLNLEREQAAMATDAANYATANKVALAGTDQWTDDTSDIETQMNDYREAVRKRIGAYPNVLQLGPRAFNALQVHSQVKDRFKYTGRESVTEEMLARFFNLDRVSVGKAVSLPDGAAEDADFVDVWGNNAILARVALTGPRVRVPSYGYTYQLAGHPLVEMAYQDRNAKSWIYPLTWDRRPYMTGMDAGYLIQTPAA